MTPSTPPASACSRALPVSVLAFIYAAPLLCGGHDWQPKESCLSIRLCHIGINKPRHCIAVTAVILHSCYTENPWCSPLYRVLQGPGRP